MNRHAWMSLARCLWHIWLDMNIRQVLFLRVRIHLVEIVIHVRENLRSVFRRCIGNMSLVVTAVLIKFLNLPASYFVDHIFILLHFRTVHVPFDTTVDVVGGQWISLVIHLLVVP